MDLYFSQDLSQSKRAQTLPYLKKLRGIFSSFVSTQCMNRSLTNYASGRPRYHVQNMTEPIIFPSLFFNFTCFSFFRFHFSFFPNFFFSGGCCCSCRFNNSELLSTSYFAGNERADNSKIRFLEGIRTFDSRTCYWPDALPLEL